MPIREFLCPDGHITEKLFLSCEEDEQTTTVPCHVCLEDAARADMPSRIGAPILKGAGFYKPSLD